MQRVWLYSGAVALTLALNGGAASAQSLATTERIEEDWVLVMNDQISDDGPQVNTVMSPSADLSQPALVFDINYRHDPTFVQGGLQLFVYDKTGRVSSVALATQPLATPNETVKWTQRMALSGGTVSYSIPSLTSQTWDDWEDDRVLASFTTSLSTMVGAYDPAASASNSGGAWKTSGLKSLTLVAVRYYVNDVLVTTDKTPRAVDFSKPFSKP